MSASQRTANVFQNRSVLFTSESVSEDPPDKVDDQTPKDTFETFNQNRRECMKALVALGATLAVPSLAIVTASDATINAAWLDLKSSRHHGLDDHPRISLLRSQVRALPVDEVYKNELLHSIELYRTQILDRPECAGGKGWDDLEDLQQVTLGDMNERWFVEQREAANRLELDRIEAAKTQVRDFIESNGHQITPDTLLAMRQFEAPAEPEDAAYILAAWVLHGDKSIIVDGNEYTGVSYVQWATSNSTETAFVYMKNRFPFEWERLNSWMELQQSAISKRVQTGFFGSPAILGAARKHRATKLASFLGNAVKLGRSS